MQLHPLTLLRRAAHRIGNLLRRRAKLDYVLFTLPAAMPTLPEPRSWLMRRLQGDAPLSLWELDKHFERIAADPRVQGVVLHLRGFAMPMASLQTLRGSIAKLRSKGKRVICYAMGYDNATYYVASAANEIILQPGGEVNTIGLRQEALFLKDSLAQVGVTFDVVAISPYKSAFDQFGSADASPEFREQVNWLLESRWEMLTGGIAEGRSISREAASGMIDHAPYTDEEALTAKYVDAVLNEEQLGEHLNAKHLLTWKQANRALYRVWKRQQGKPIALMRLDGLIIPGESGRTPGNLPLPLVGEARTGDLTFVRQIRTLLKEKRLGAVVLYIDSGGGSSAASEAMTAALDQVAKQVPVVAYMDSVAASGGYYVATPAKWIVAQPGTITGSIGVLSAKLVTGGVYDKLRAHPVEFTRGANAAMYSEGHPFTPEQREKMHTAVNRIYRQFLERVASSRGMTTDAVDMLGGGRVWTGEQAYKNGLIDQMGGLETAFSKARELAQLSEDTPIMLVSAGKDALPPMLAQPTAALEYAYENLRLISSGAVQMLGGIIFNPRL